MSDQDNSNDTVSATQSEETRSLSRRNLLLGTAGLTVGSVLTAPAAFAQHGRVPNSMLHQASHDIHGASLSNRVYTVNPVHPDMADVAENPANVPPPIAPNWGASLLASVSASAAGTLVGTAVGESLPPQAARKKARGIKLITKKRITDISLPPHTVRYFSIMEL